MAHQRIILHFVIYAIWLFLPVRMAGAPFYAYDNGDEIKIPVKLFNTYDWGKGPTKDEKNKPNKRMPQNIPINVWQSGHKLEVFIQSMTPFAIISLYEEEPKDENWNMVISCNYEETQIPINFKGIYTICIKTEDQIFYGHISFD